MCARKIFSKVDALRHKRSARGKPRQQRLAIRHSPTTVPHQQTDTVDPLQAGEVTEKDRGARLIFKGCGLLPSLENWVAVQGAKKPNLSALRKDQGGLTS